MQSTPFPVIDLAATGENITRLRKARGLTVRDVQAYFGFEEPQAVYKWQRGKSLPTVDNLYALSHLLGVPMNDILVPRTCPADRTQQAGACCASFLGERRPFHCAEDTGTARKSHSTCGSVGRKERANDVPETQNGT